MKKLKQEHEFRMEEMKQGALNSIEGCRFRCGALGKMINMEELNELEKTYCEYWLRNNILSLFEKQEDEA